MLTARGSTALTARGSTALTARGSTALTAGGSTALTAGDSMALIASASPGGADSGIRSRYAIALRAEAVGYGCEACLRRLHGCSSGAGREGAVTLVREITPQPIATDWA